MDNSVRDPDVTKPATPNGEWSAFLPDLFDKHHYQCAHPGDRYVRVVRHTPGDFRVGGPNVLVAGPEDTTGKPFFLRNFARLKHALIGHPLSNLAAEHERLTKVKALAVLSSDALSSVAYATEEILRVLLLAGLAALTLSLPVGAGIVLLLIIVGMSYRQTIKAYPHGGGSYIVAKDNLGETPALVAGGALLVDYILTVAVSVSSAVGALVSVFPAVHDHLVLWGAGFIVLVTVLNLRGIRESGGIFAVPTYLFLVAVGSLIIVGVLKNASEGFAVHEPTHPVLAGTGGVTLFLVLRAFSSGCSALTGVEAISDGVPAFQKPEWKNARTTLTWMIGMLAVMFAGITFLAHQYGAVPLEQGEAGYETVVSQVTRGVFGGTNAGYYVIQFATIAILILAANTAYSDFPRLAWFMARDKYMPSQFMFRGDRLAYSFGIITLGAMSILVLAAFGGQTEKLIPLYAVGVFTSFTLSQFGMVMRWTKLRETGWKSSRIMNGVGALATGTVALVVAITKFTHGAWIVMLLIPLLVMMFRGIHRHYRETAAQADVDLPLAHQQISHMMVVPVSRLNTVSRQTLAYARSITSNVVAVHITSDPDNLQELQEQWNREQPGVPLVIIESPYRALTGPLVHYVSGLKRRYPNAVITVVVPEYVPQHWWEQLLHNQTALRIKTAMMFQPEIVVTTVRYRVNPPSDAPNPAST